MSLINKAGSNLKVLFNIGDMQQVGAPDLFFGFIPMK
jgi:hypothetical protein